jgi:hypothetical protein
VRILFQNVKGLTYSNLGDDYEYYLNCLQELQTDIAGLAETNTPWQLFHKRNDFLSRARKYHSITKVVFGGPSETTDPVASKDNFQAGGTLTIVQDKWATTVHNEVVQDSTGLGRWSGMSFRGKRNRIITVITGYQTCKGTIQSSGFGTTYHREYMYYREKGTKTPNPRQSFLNELGMQYTR